jgi:hypothetical protein
MKKVESGGGAPAQLRRARGEDTPEIESGEDDLHHLRFESLD